MKDKLATVIKESSLSPGLKSGDEVSIVYAYIYNNLDYCMIKRITDNARFDIPISSLQIK